jgi:hypothetical protein
MTHVSYLKVLSHEEIQRRRRLRTNAADAVAAMSQKAQTQVSTQFSFFVKQQTWELVIYKNNVKIKQLQQMASMQKCSDKRYRDD